MPATIDPMRPAPIASHAHKNDWNLSEAIAELKYSLGNVANKSGRILAMIWGRMSRRIRMLLGMCIFVVLLMLLNILSYPPQKAITLSLWRPSASDLPSIKLEYRGAIKSPYNSTRVALLIENRPNPILAPLVLHFMSVVPPEWRFRFMGSNISVASINQSAAIRDAVRIGKLDLTYIPANMTTNSQEEISQFLTNRWIYETVLAPAEHLLVFQTDSMLCANSRQSINDWLEYDWVGAPWNPSGKWGGNGGLSLRKVSAILDILKNQVRSDKMPEDVWLAERLAHRPGAKMANGTASLTFSGEMHSGEVVTVPPPSPADGEAVEKKEFDSGIDSVATAEDKLPVDLWRDGFYEPMGYHTGDNGRTMHSPIWGTPEKRAHIWNYCPEVKMIFEMDAAEYVLGDCHNNWKRDGGVGTGEMGKRDGDVNLGDYTRERGEYDEDGIPYALDRLVAW